MKEKLSPEPNHDQELFTLTARDQKLKPELVTKLRELFSLANTEQADKGHWEDAEILEIVNNFIKFRLALKRIIPNELFEMLAKHGDVSLAEETYKKYLIWCGHEGSSEVNSHLKYFMKEITDELKKRKNWTTQQFDDEYN